MSVSKYLSLTDSTKVGPCRITIIIIARVNNAVQGLTNRRLILFIVLLFTILPQKSRENLIKYMPSVKYYASPIFMKGHI